LSLDETDSQLGKLESIRKTWVN